MPGRLNVVGSPGELHDELGQSLTALKLLLSTKGRQFSREAAEVFGEAAEEVARILEEVRHMSRELRPPVLDDLGLLAALKWHLKMFEERVGVRVRFDCSSVDETMLESQLRTTIFRIIQESLTNVARHAKATKTTIRLLQTPCFVRIDISDDGIGFDAANIAQNPSSGLAGMQERVGLARGRCCVRSSPGGGTNIQVELPINMSVAPKAPI